MYYLIAAERAVFFMPRPEFGKPETGGFGETERPDFLQIRHASKMLRLNALETFPLDVGDWTADFSASMGDQMVAAYGPILPGTKFSWEASYKSGRLVPADTQFDFWHAVDKEEGRNSRETFVRGGRFAVHEFKADGDDTFNEFKRVFVEAFSERGYDLDSALVSTPQDSVTLRVYRNGNIELSMVTIFDEENLESNEDFSKAAEDELREWFERLAQGDKRERADIKTTS
jgi:hypothetical protein